MSIIYNNYSRYLREKYNGRAYRVAVDPGFSCPNRSNGRGCTYCDAHGARAVYLDNSVIIKQQIENGLAFLKKRYMAEHFLLYFQAFSGTYSSVDKLKEIYDYSLSLGSFRELIVSTRPDCIDEEKAVLLRSYLDKGYDVWVELGLQSCHDRTLEKIKRGHTLRDFETAFNLLKSYGIKTAVHLIFGLPGESFEDMMKTVKYISHIHPEGVKFHNLHVAADTDLYDEYMAGGLSVPCLMRHIEYLISAIELLPQDILIMRLTCDTPSARRIAPRRDLKKTEVYSVLEKMMKGKNTYQGRLYKD